ncbi:MAG: alpha-glucuronidase [Clostridia bacterium]|nr:alpha-glucuronidase [Clostridia bacterium]
MAGWEERRAWLRCMEKAAWGDTPLEVAKNETAAYFSNGKTVEFQLEQEMQDSFEISGGDQGWRVRGGETGVLYGAYALIRACEAGETVPAGVQAPSYALRMINCWDNMDGSVERGYAGRSIWFEGNRFEYEPARIRQLGRLLASVGINVLCVNNVNVHQPAQHLLDGLLPDTARFAALLRPFGVRLMLSIDFSQPMQQGLSTADPLDAGVQAWWAETAKRVWTAIPDLAGFLVKADSEHRPGPNTYGRTHAEGANMLARAIAPYGGRLVWRAFVYNCMQDWRDKTIDRPRAAYDLYMPLDGAFDGNVILQVKHGPYDFQVREPLSPLLLGMEKTPLAVEFQLAQEYTGHQIDLYYMASLWRETFSQMGKGSVTAVAAVSNLGRDDCWTGHPFAMANLFAYGLFAWDPDSDPEKALRQWVKLTYALPAGQEDSLTAMLMDSRAVYERYTATLGLCWMVQPNIHYGPSPYGYEFQAWGTYNRADRNAVGIDRTKNGTGYAEQYPEPLRSLYADPQTCPDNLLLFFHRLPYDFVMKDGRTLIQRIYDDHFQGCQEAEAMGEALSALSLPSPDREEAAERMQAQIRNAREWRDVTNTFFHRFSGAEDRHGRTIYD